MKRKNVKVLMCGLLAGTMLFTTSGAVEAVASETEQTAEEDGRGPIVEEKMTFTVATQLNPAWGNPEEGEFWKNLEEETNIHIEWITFSENEAPEKFKLMMASGDYPDAFIGRLGGSDNDVITYGSDGIYIPLNDLIEENCPNFKRRVSEEYPETMKMITCADGNIYAMPYVALYNPDVYNLTFINKKWLDAVGAEVPTTTDEFKEVLKKFKEEDPNGNGEADEIPFSLIMSDWGQSDPGPYFGAFGYPLAPDYLMVDNNEVKYLGAQEGYKETAKWFAELYEEGLLDMDCFTQDDPTYNAKISQNQIGVFNSWDVHSRTGEYKDDYVALMPLKGPNGEQNQLVEGSAGFYKGVFQITDKCKNPEILMQWVDRMYRDVEMGMDATYGLKDKVWYYDENDKIVLMPKEQIPEGYARGEQQLPFAPAFLGKETAEFMADPVKLEMDNAVMEYAQKFKDGTWKRFPNTYMTFEEKEDIATTETDLQTYSKNNLAKWIAGESDPDADWDSYLEELEKIGLSHYLEVKQQIYERYESAK